MKMVKKESIKMKTAKKNKKFVAGPFKIIYVLVLEIDYFNFFTSGKEYFILALLNSPFCSIPNIDCR